MAKKGWVDVPIPEDLYNAIGDFVEQKDFAYAGGIHEFVRDGARRLLDHFRYYDEKD